MTLSVGGGLLMVEKKPVSNVNGWLLLAGCGQRVEKMEIKSEWGSSIEENEVQNPQKSSSSACLG